jgi:hypothetical protein
MFDRVAMPDWEEINEGNADVSATDQARNTLEVLGDAYAKRLGELLSDHGNKCAFGECAGIAAEFRWLPERTQEGNVEFREHVLCRKHARQWDDARSLSTAD